MSDVRLNYEAMKFDINYRLGDLDTDEGLESSVLISLFTDKRVREEELPPGEESRRGWWGDEISPFFDDQGGSKLWLLDRGKIDSTTRNKVEEYAREALDWLTDDGVASEVVVKAIIVDRERIDLSVEITKPKERNKFTYRFQLVWEGQLMNVRKV